MSVIAADVFPVVFDQILQVNVHYVSVFTKENFLKQVKNTQRKKILKNRFWI
jgi:hypothetical protein